VSLRAQLAGWGLGCTAFRGTMPLCVSGCTAFVLLAGAVSCRHIVFAGGGLIGVVWHFPVPVQYMIAVVEGSAARQVRISHCRNCVHLTCVDPGLRLTVMLTYGSLGHPEPLVPCPMTSLHGLMVHGGVRGVSQHDTLEQLIPTIGSLHKTPRHGRSYPSIRTTRWASVNADSC
jgi:hypothetical protein